MKKWLFKLISCIYLSCIIGMALTQVYVLTWYVQFSGGATTCLALIFISGAFDDFEKWFKEYLDR